MAVELDYMEYATPAAAQTAYVSSDALFIISNADIDDEDMADISDWADGDTGDGASTQETFDGKSCMKLANIAVSSTASRTQDIGTFGTKTVFSMNLYHDSLGTLADGDRFMLRIYDGNNRVLTPFASDGLFVFYGQYQEIGTNLVVQDTWQEWTFDINWTAGTMDVYLDKVLVASAVNCTSANATDNGTVHFQQTGSTSASQITYIDWFKAGTAMEGSLQSYSESTIIQQGTYSLKGVAVITDSLNDTLTRTI